MASDEPNPYASPQAVVERAATTPRLSAWSNRVAAGGFLLSMIFPLAALFALTALFMEDSFGVVRWRVHRVIRMILFYTSVASLSAVFISLAGLAVSPRRLAIYGVFIGTLGAAYLALALMNVIRR